MRADRAECGEQFVAVLSAQFVPQVDLIRGLAALALPVQPLLDLREREEGLVAVPAAGCGKSGWRRRQLETAARVTPARRAISAAVTTAARADSAAAMSKPYTPPKKGARDAC